ncbi:SEC-C motif-containing protein [Halobacillus karajensis]|uniref:SEC-C metal-binding domain-containing protein n=1 Tax=Halobacillus karajensis TaxID=195088 RepID=UPI0008A7605E|nr:SEC-C metal-binding domain-containing protein [Halobacillus karajensis]SEH40326.1 SEC-C motif-containing protein [Halobacillus karajensis]
MSKVKRNDPCPCGSGKKYKKCCMNKADQGVGSTSLHEELKAHYSHFMAYVNRNYPNISPNEERETQEEEVEAAFRMVQSVFIEQQEDGTTLYDEFFDKKKDKIVRPATLASMEAWKSPLASVFQIKELQTVQTVLVEDVWSGQKYEVKRDGIPLKEDNYEHMPYVIGVVLKWGPVFNFVPLAIPNYKETYESFKQNMEEEFAQSSHDSIHALMQETLIEQLRNWLYLNVSETKKDQIEQETTPPVESTPTQTEDEVLDLVDEELKSEKAFEQLREAWMSYKQEEAPMLRKPKVVSAALEHIYRTSEQFRAEPEKVTKKAVAEKYDVSPSSMSKRITQIKDYIEN